MFSLSRYNDLQFATKHTSCASKQSMKEQEATALHLLFVFFFFYETGHQNTPDRAPLKF